MFLIIVCLVEVLYKPDINVYFWLVLYIMCVVYRYTHTQSNSSSALRWEVTQNNISSSRAKTSEYSLSVPIPLHVLLHPTVGSTSSPRCTGHCYARENTSPHWPVFICCLEVTFVLVLQGARDSPAKQDLQTSPTLLAPRLSESTPPLDPHLHSPISLSRLDTFKTPLCYINTRMSKHTGGIFMSFSWRSLRPQWRWLGPVSFQFGSLLNGWVGNKEIPSMNRPRPEAAWAWFTHRPRVRGICCASQTEAHVDWMWR